MTGLVVRPAPGERRRVEELELDTERGVVGDYWQDGEPGAAVTLINTHVLASLADGDEERMALSGDNLQVDLDLSEPNLPAGTHLTIGEVVLRISEEPHRPCRSFVGRFGALAAKRVARAGRRGLRGRGVLCDVVQGGVARVGDSIYVRRFGDWTYND